jgi:acetyl esterase/lipase
MAGRSPPPKETRIEPVDADGIPAAWISGPGANRDHALLYLHGGGYYNGSLTTHQGLAASVSDKAKVVPVFFLS